MTFDKRLLGVLATGLLVGCPAVPLPSAEAPSIVGRVEPFTVRSAQATLTEVANAATVSLIDVASNQTVGTTVTTSDGSFVLTFGTTFTPTPGATYYIEAVKGLSAGGTSNRPGASGARVRTMLQYAGGWKSLTSATAGDPINLGRSTTALSAIASLNGFDQASSSALIGSVRTGVADATLTPNTPDSFTTGTTGISNAAFHQVFGLIDNALTLDQDPMGVVFRDSSGNYVRRPVTLRVTNVSPRLAAPGATVTLTGQDFPPASMMTVLVGPYSASVTSVSGDRKTAQFTLPGTGLLPEAASISLRVDGIDSPLGDFRYAPTLGLDFEDGSVTGWTNNTTQSGGSGTVVNALGATTSDNAPGTEHYLSNSVQGIVANYPSTTAYGTWKFDMIRNNHHEFWPIQNNTSTWMSSGEGYLLWVEAGGELYFSRVTGGGTTHLGSVPSNVPLGKWGHYRIERDYPTGAWRIYENGILKIAVTDNTLTASTYLGSYYWDVPANAGGLDNLKVWAWR